MRVNLEFDMLGKYAVAPRCRCMRRAHGCHDHNAMTKRTSGAPVGARPRSRIAKGPRRSGPFASIEDALDAIRAGRVVIVVDDEDRENEGDLTVAAEKVTPEIVNFMATHGRGLVCLALTPERLDALEIPLEVLGELLGARDRDVRVDRRARQDEHRHLGRGPRGDDPHGARPEARSRRTCCVPDTCSRCARATAACWCAPATPKPPSISRASPASRRPASSARS